jgi:tetratricopeptide (TPR) repeat protein
MRAKERRHLKENDLAHSIASAREYIEPRRKQITAALVVVFLIITAIAGIFVMRQQTQARADEKLAEAMAALDAPVIPSAPPENAPPGTPPPVATAQPGTFLTEEAKLHAALPKLKEAADAYPDAKAGITARYHYASTLATLGKHQEAIAAFDDVAKRDSSGIYGRMARLGKADAQAATRQYEAAIATYKELAERTDSELPTDAILMQLARTQMAAGKRDDATKTFTRIVDEHPDSPYYQAARKQLDSLKG